MPVGIQVVKAAVMRIAPVAEECGIDEIYTDLTEYKCGIYDNVTALLKMA